MQCLFLNPHFFLPSLQNEPELATFSFFPRLGLASLKPYSLFSLLTGYIAQFSLLLYLKMVKDHTIWSQISFLTLLSTVPSMSLNA